MALSELEEIMATPEWGAANNAKRREATDHYYLSVMESLGSEEEKHSLLEEREDFLTQFNINSARQEREAGQKEADKLGLGVNIFDDRAKQDLRQLSISDNQARVEEFKSIERDVQAQNNEQDNNNKLDETNKKIQQLTEELEDANKVKDSPIGELTGQRINRKSLESRLSREKINKIRQESGGIKSDKLRENVINPISKRLSNSDDLLGEAALPGMPRGYDTVAAENYRYTEQDANGISIRKNPDLKGGFQIRVNKDDGESIELSSREEFSLNSRNNLLKENIDAVGDYSFLWDRVLSLSHGAVRDFESGAGYIDMLIHAPEQILLDRDREVGNITDEQWQEASDKIEKDQSRNFLTKLTDTLTDKLSQKERIAREVGADKTLGIFNRGDLTGAFGQLGSTVATGGAASVGGKILLRSVAKKGSRKLVIGSLAAKNFLSIAGSETDAAVALGADPIEAIGIGAFSSLMQTPIETGADLLQVRLLTGGGMSTLRELGLESAAKSRFKTGVVSSLVEGGTEGAQKIIGDSVAVSFYDSTRDAWDAAGISYESAIGAIVGASAGYVGGGPSAEQQETAPVHKFDEQESVDDLSRELARLNAGLENPVDQLTEAQRYGPPDTGTEETAIDLSEHPQSLSDSHPEQAKWKATIEGLMDQSRRDPSKGFQKIWQLLNDEVIDQLNDIQLVEGIDPDALLARETSEALVKQANAFIAARNITGSDPTQAYAGQEHINAAAIVLQGLTFLHGDEVALRHTAGKIADFFGDVDPSPIVGKGNVEFVPSLIDASKGKYKEAIAAGRPNGQVGMNIQNYTEEDYNTIPVYTYNEESDKTETTTLGSLDKEETRNLPSWNSETGSNIEIEFYTAETVESMYNEMVSEGHFPEDSVIFVKDDQGANSKGLHEIGPGNFNRIPKRIGSSDIGYLFEPFSDRRAYKSEQIREYRVPAIIRNGAIEVIPYSMAQRSNHRDFNPIMFDTADTKRIEEGVASAPGAPTDFSVVPDGSIVGMDVTIHDDGSLEVGELNASDPQVDGVNEGTGRSGFMENPFATLAIAAHLKGTVPSHIRIARAAMVARSSAYELGDPHVDIGTKAAVAKIISATYGESENSNQFEEGMVIQVGDWIAPHAKNIYDSMSANKGKIGSGTTAFLNSVDEQLTENLGGPVRLKMKSPDVIAQALKTSSSRKVAPKVAARRIAKAREHSTLHEALGEFVSDNGNIGKMARLLQKKVPKDLRFKVKKLHHHGDYNAKYQGVNSFIPASVRIAEKSFHEGNFIEVLFHESIHAVSFELIADYNKGYLDKKDPLYKHVAKLDSIRQGMIKAGAKRNVAESKGQDYAEYQFSLDEFHSHVLTSSEYIDNLQKTVGVKTSSEMRNAIESQFRNGGISRRGRDHGMIAVDVYEDLLSYGKDGDTMVQRLVALIKKILGINDAPTVDEAIMSAIAVLRNSPDSKPYEFDWSSVPQPLGWSSTRPRSAKSTKPSMRGNPENDANIKYISDNNIVEAARSILAGDTLRQFNKTYSQLTGNIPANLADKAETALRRFAADGNPVHIGDYDRALVVNDQVISSREMIDDNGTNVFGKPGSTIPETSGVGGLIGSFFYNRGFMDVFQRLKKIGYHPKASSLVNGMMDYVFEGYDKFDSQSRRDIKRVDSLAKKHKIKMNDTAVSAKLGFVSAMTQWNSTHKDLKLQFENVRKSIVAGKQSHGFAKSAALAAEQYMIRVKRSVSPDQPPKLVAKQIEDLMLSENEANFLADIRVLFGEKQDALLGVSAYVYGERPVKNSNYIRRSVQRLNRKDELSKDYDLMESPQFNLNDDKTKLDKESSIIQDRKALGKDQFYNLDLFNLIADGIHQSNYEIYTALDRRQLTETTRSEELQNELARSENGETVLGEMAAVSRSVHNAEVTPGEGAGSFQFMLSMANTVKKIKVSSPSKIISQTLPLMDAMTKMDGAGAYVAMTTFTTIGFDGNKPSRVGATRASKFIKEHAPRIHERVGEISDVMISPEQRAVVLAKTRHTIGTAIKIPNTISDAFAARRIFMGKYAQVAIEAGVFNSVEDFKQRYDKVVPMQSHLTEAQRFSEQHSHSSISRSLGPDNFKQRELRGRALMDQVFAFAKTQTSMGQEMMLHGRNMRGFLSSDKDLQRQARESLTAAIALATIQYAGYVILDRAVKYALLPTTVFLTSKIPFLPDPDDDEEVAQQVKIGRAKLLGTWDDNGVFISPQVFSALTKSFVGMTGLLNPISGFTSNLVHNKTGWDYGVPELKEERKRLKDELKAFEDQVKGFGMEVPLETIAKYEKSIEIMDALISGDPSAYDESVSGVTGMMLEGLFGSIEGGPGAAAGFLAPFGLESGRKINTKADNISKERTIKERIKSVNATRKNLGMPPVKRKDFN